MVVSAKGRYANVGWNPEHAPATKRQRFALWIASDRKVDYRPEAKKLSQAEAEEMLRKIRRERCRNESFGTVRNGQVEDAFAAVLRKAAEAASKAGDEWMEEHPEPVFWIFHEDLDYEEPIHGRIGDAFIGWPQKRTKFDRWLCRNAFTNDRRRVPVPHDYAERREYELLLVCEEAALKVFEASGVRGLKLLKRPAGG